MKIRSMQFKFLMTVISAMLAITVFIGGLSIYEVDNFVQEQTENLLMHQFFSFQNPFIYLTTIQHPGFLTTLSSNTPESTPFASTESMSRKFGFAATAEPSLSAIVKRIS